MEKNSGRARSNGKEWASKSDKNEYELQKINNKNIEVEKIYVTFQSFKFIISSFLLNLLKFFFFGNENKNMKIFPYSCFQKNVQRKHEIELNIDKNKMEKKKKKLINQFSK